MEAGAGRRIQKQRRPDGLFDGVLDALCRDGDRTYRHYRTAGAVGICGDIEYDAVRGQGPARRRDTDPTPCLVGNLRLAIAVGQKCQFDTASRSIHAFGRLLDGRDTDLVEEEGTHQHTFAVRDENDDFAVIVYLCAGNENDFAIDARRIVGLHLDLHIGRG